MQKIDNKKELKHLYRASARKAEIHEIYLSDIRRAVPEKWRTIIRQPFSILQD